MQSTIETVLRERHGLALPPPPEAGGVFDLAKRTGNLLYVGGQISSHGPELITGRLGAELDLEAGRRAARYCLLNLLAIVKKELGSFSRVQRFVYLQAFVQSADDFHQQTAVVNGASELLLDLFGQERGFPVRMALGANALPVNAAVEIMTVVEIAD